MTPHVPIQHVTFLTKSVGGKIGKIKLTKGKGIGPENIVLGTYPDCPCRFFPVKYISCVQLLDWLYYRRQKKSYFLFFSISNTIPYKFHFGTPRHRPKSTDDCCRKLNLPLLVELPCKHITLIVNWICVSKYVVLKCFCPSATIVFQKNYGQFFYMSH